MSSDVSSDNVSGVVRKRKARQRTDFLDDDDDPITHPSKLPKKCKTSKQLAPVSHEVTHKKQTNVYGHYLNHSQKPSLGISGFCENLSSPRRNEVQPPTPSVASTSRKPAPYRKRVKRLTVPLFNIIMFVAPSHFRKRARAFYKEVGERKAQGAEGRLKAVAGLSCGYYGTKGGRAISGACFDIFMRAKDGEKPLLTSDATSPLPPIEFLQDVLVPEAAVMLIMEDQRMDWHCAHALLNESADYGTAMFPDNGDVGARGLVWIRQ
ncbi:hypothetical protein HKX48_001592 [Thoreauomyces humboldtii]|nr:hypothetical protein HKX48_001592 [Thoreauomyces humboldtii]